MQIQSQSLGDLTLSLIGLSKAHGARSWSTRVLVPTLCDLISSTTKLSCWLTLGKPLSCSGQYGNGQEFLRTEETPSLFSLRRLVSFCQALWPERCLACGHSCWHCGSCTLPTGLLCYLLGWMGCVLVTFPCGSSRSGPSFSIPFSIM